ncbi:hypothetical protein ES703_06648 [subsurface metagenome]
MKYKKILRIFGIAIILSLLVVAVPVAAQTRFVDLDPDEGKIGDRITVVGEGFNASSDTTDKYANVYFSSQEASTVHDIDDDVTIYEKLKEGVWLDEDGAFETTFDVPDELDDGDDDEDVEAGTYYVYVCHYPYPDIRAYAEFTVVGGEIDIDPDDGPAGTEVEITGTDFSSEEDISIEYDGDEIDIEDGDDETDNDGEFLAVILIPESTAGDHTITVTVSDNEVEAEFTVEPEIFLDPLSGSANTTVTVSGTGFGRRQEVVIYFYNAGLATATTSTEGSFDTTFTVPELGTDIYDVEVEDEDENTDSAKFTVTSDPSISPTPTPSPSPAPAPPISATTASISASDGPVGASISIVGTGFEADGTVAIEYDDEELATITANSDGMFIVAFEVPPSKYGDHTITLSDGTNTHELPFVVESTPPEVPSPLLPELGVSVKPPISFDWKDVDDESTPVTYTLQVATSTDFSAASIVLEKEELTESEYTVTEGEESMLVAQETPYFWRIRAIDAASNEGDWTGPGTFYIAEAFGLPDWLLYVLIGLGGLLLFIVGYLLGRRTAYY